MDLKGSGCALTFGDPPVEQVRGPRGEFMMYVWATGADYDPFLNPLMSEWTQVKLTDPSVYWVGLTWGCSTILLGKGT